MIKKVKSTNRKISPLTLKILGVNIAALFMLAFGFLYSTQYESQLVESELNSLNQEAKMIAAAVSEGGVRERFDETPVLARDLSQLMIRKMSAETDFRIILFDNAGNLVADSHRLSGAGSIVEIYELPPPNYMRSWNHYLENTLSFYLRFLPTRLNLKEFPSTDSSDIQTFPDMINTLKGDVFKQAWHDENQKILLTVSHPVARLKQVLGGVMLIRTGKRVEQAIKAVQLNVLRIFFGTLAITIFLSIYLSTTIATPIRRLSMAADRMRTTQSDKNLIPDLSNRGDEIGDLSVSLRELTEALSARLAAIESFAADVAHELKNPLASVQSAIETLPKVKDDKTRKKLEDIIYKDTQRLDRLISDISSASRLDAELNRVEKTFVDIFVLLNAIKDMYNDQMQNEHDVSLETDMIKNQCYISGNEGRLSQVFSNILNNGMTFAEKETPMIIRLNKENDLVYIRIENQGPAIPENKLESIFNRFYSERPKNDEFGQHSGLGLSISRQIIHAHDGEIWAENIIDRNGQHLGVRFNITLPLIQPV